MQASMCHDRPITSRCSMTAHPNKKKPVSYRTSNIGARGSARKPVRRYARLDNNTRRTVDRGASRSSNNSSSTSNRTAWILHRPPFRHPPHPTEQPLSRLGAASVPSVFRLVSTDDLLSSPSTNTPLAPKFSPFSVSPLRPLLRMAAPTTCHGHPYVASKGGRTCRG